MYVDSLDACKGHYDLGVSIGQQRKVKELVNWLRKKKRRVIRKDELITFLIGTNPNMKANMAGNGLMAQPTSRRQQQQETTSLTQITSTNSATHRRQSQLDTIVNGANSDLATFREALIMHTTHSKLTARIEMQIRPKSLNIVNRPCQDTEFPGQTRSLVDT